MGKKEVTTDDVTLDASPLDLERGADNIKHVAVMLDANLDDVVAMEAFMQEKMDIFLSEPSSESESPLAEVTVNGRYMPFRRGEAYSNVPRYAVEALARSRTTRITTEKRLQPDRSEEMVPIQRHTASYPFSVMRDPSGAKGMAWLKGILSQPA